MQFSTIAVSSFMASMALASFPANLTDSARERFEGLQSRQTSYEPCSDTLYSNADCCAVDVLGVADLDCETVSSTPANATDFESICATGGKEAMCCTLDLLEIGILCDTPVGL